ncbi:hypothetical protein [Helicobacter sp. 13S00477-4]|uniref:hypothetical protein n=1 Tax=Helicobacter sp. 13S00477-4 TaxID=1905759 RepID=UPI000BA79F81|nr:hypothetical protein [Helicobacter sp. 13S00477-4]PAF51983.1 hypothetical protein BKH44_04805 [Helicobacter sp. 13S00477-4]
MSMIEDMFLGNMPKPKPKPKEVKPMTKPAAMLTPASKIPSPVESKEATSQFYVNVIKLKFIGEDFIIRTRYNQHFKLKKNDIVYLPNDAYGLAFARMKIFEMLD